MDGKVGREYRHKVLEKGGSRDELEVLEDYLGRKPSTEYVPLLASCSPTSFISAQVITESSGSPMSAVSLVPFLLLCLRILGMFS
jgi:hypothetical protein